MADGAISTGPAAKVFETLIISLTLCPAVMSSLQGLGVMPLKYSVTDTRGDSRVDHTFKIVRKQRGKFLTERRGVEATIQPRAQRIYGWRKGMRKERKVREVKARPAVQHNYMER